MRLYAALAALVVLVPSASAERRRRVRPHVESVHVHTEPPMRLRAMAPPPAAPAAPAASLTLHTNAIQASVTAEMGMTSGAPVAAPASIAPDLSFGVTNAFTLSAITSGAALTGFRGGAGAGICMGGTDRSCRVPFNGGGIEGLFSVTTGSAAFALNAGVMWSAIEPSVHTDLKLGFKLKMTEGKLFALVSPSVWLALDDRYDRVVPHEHQLFVPIGLFVKPVRPLALGIGTGVKGPIKHFADRMAIPLGASATYAVDKHWTLGTSFVFGKLFAGSDVMDPGIDARAIQVWLSVLSG